ncbi:MFS transporter [Sphingomonas flavalba]|uniref:MFS transporter n=1 Tax=Sphingomonas flavalba TaxID=2559804 RepID=UPI0039E1C042
MAGSRTLAIGVMSASTSGQLTQITLPFMVGALITGLNLNEQQAGLLCSAELITVALVSFAVAPLMGAWPRRTVAIIGAAIAILAHGFSATLVDLPSIVAARMVAGFGAGLMLAAGNASIANSPNPDRLSSLLLISVGLAQLVSLSLLPLIIPKWQHSGIFAYQAMLIALLVPLVMLLPQRRADSTDPAGTRPVPAKLPIGPTLAIVTAIALFSARETALWAFTEQIGLRSGLTKAQIGVILGATGVLALSGAGAAAIIGTRFSRMKPLMIGLVFNAVLAFWISQTSNATVFAIVEVVYHAFLFFTAPYLFGLAAELDPSGRIVASAGGALLFGGSLGPVIGGYLIAIAGFAAIGAFILASVAVVMLLAWQLQRRLDRQSATV